MRTNKVPAVCVLLAGAAPLRALVDVSAAHPGLVGGKAGLTVAVEAASGVDAVRILPAVGSAVEVSVVDVALVQLIAGGLRHVCLAVVAVSAVLIVEAADIAVATPVVVLVAFPVAAVVAGGEAKPDCVVGIVRCGEVLGVEALVVTTHRPSGVLTVGVIDTVTLPLPAGVVRGAPPLTAVIIRIPASSRVTPGCQAVVLTADHGSLTVTVMIAVSAVFLTGRVWPAAVLSSPTRPWQSLRSCDLDHDPLLSPVSAIWARVL